LIDCSNYAPLERTVLRSPDSERDKKKTEKKRETKASSHAGQCIPVGYSVSLPKRVLITVSIITMRSISRKLCVRLFTLCKISTAILRILWRHLQTDLRNI